MLIIYSFIHRKDNLDVGVVKCACILRGWSEVVQMARTPLRDSATISLDFDTILWSSDVLRFANNTVIRLDTSLCYKKKNVFLWGVIWRSLVETYHIVKYLSSLSVLPEPWEGLRLFYDSSPSTSVSTRFSQVVIYNIIPSLDIPTLLFPCGL